MADAQRERSARDGAAAFDGSALGAVDQVSVSAGGVPKRAVPEATITTGGVSGDRQRNTKLHGGPERAVCLFSADVIDRLQAEGHPIAPGTAGENITLRGIDWSLVQPGTRLRLGEAALLQVTRYTTPCANITDSFAGGRIDRINVKRYPGESRVYARVLAEGMVRPGDRAELLADATVEQRREPVRP